MKNNKNADTNCKNLSDVFLKAMKTIPIAIKPREAAKYLWTTYGITLSISYGKLGYLLSAIAISASEVGNVTKP